MVHGKWDSYTLFFFRHLNHVQGAYYLINGVWPLLSIGTFQAITGPKTDLWLVETVGLFLMINGLILILAAYRRQTDWSVLIIGLCTPLALAGIELVYVLRGIISVVYLLDAAVELLFVIAWIRKKP